MLPASDFAFLLLKVNIAMAVTVAIVALVRPIALGLLDPETAYLRWLLVPAAMVAVLVPRTETAPTFLVLPTLTDVIPADVVVGATGDPKATALQLQAQQWSTELIILGAWALGVLAALAIVAIAQREFRRSLGRTEAANDYGDDVHRTTREIAGPFLIDILNPRIIIPRDFEDRYDGGERSLVLLHERLHRRRYDLHVLYLTAGIVCLCWFNPLAYFGWNLIRRDQELACDAAVARLRPDKRKAYGLALLRTVERQRRSPLACTLHKKSAIGERIGQISKAPVGALRKALGLLVVLCLVGAGSALAWTEQPVSSRQPAMSTDDVRFLAAQARLRSTEGSRTVTVASPDKIVIHGAMIVEFIASDRLDMIMEYGSGISIDPGMDVLTIEGGTSLRDAACSPDGWPTGTPVVRLRTSQRVKFELYGAIYLQGSDVDDLAITAGDCSATLIPGRIEDLSFIGAGGSRSFFGEIGDIAIILRDSATLSAVDGGENAQIQLLDTSFLSISRVDQRSRIDAQSGSMADIGAVGARSSLIASRAARILASELGETASVQAVNRARIVLDHQSDDLASTTRDAGEIVAAPGSVAKERGALAAAKRIAR